MDLKRSSVGCRSPFGDSFWIVVCLFRLFCWRRPRSPALSIRTVPLKSVRMA